MMPDRRGFTLVELLVVVSIIALLLGILVPSMAAARRSAEVVACRANLKSIGQAIFAYSHDYKGTIPFGPHAAKVPSPLDFYPITGFITSLLSQQDGEEVGLGLLVNDYLSDQPEVLFCPGVDDNVVTRTQLDFFRQGQAQGSYWYRHGSVIGYEVDPDTNEPVTQDDHIRLSDLGDNRQGQPIRSLAMDTNFIVNPSFEKWGVRSITHHKQEQSNALMFDGSTRSTSNADGQYSANVGTLVHFAPTRMLEAFERADLLY